MESVLVKISGHQKDADGRTAKVSNKIKGQHCIKGGKHYLTYDDNSIEKGASVATILRASADEIFVTRKGAIASRQKFIAGQSDCSSYVTPYGELALETCTQYISLKYNEATGRGRVELKYELAINGEFAGANHLKIDFLPLSAD